ncbi:MAG: leucyl aminopeptidase [Congregibacter sp.]
MASLKFTTRETLASRSQCVVLPLDTSLKLDRSAKSLAKACGGVIESAIKAGDFTGKEAETQLLVAAGNPSRVLLLGLGENPGSRDSLLKISQSLAKALLGLKAADTEILADAVKVAKTDWPWFCTTLARDLTSQSYHYDHTLSAKKPSPSLKRVSICSVDSARRSAAKKALDKGARIGAGINLAKELANRPGNHCTPEDLAKEARRLARAHDNASCKILNEKAMAELGMHSLLSVTAGTAVPARLIVLEYKGGKRGEAPHALVGKGITFDSGGISLKPGAKMDEMKFDMGGAASVLGTMDAVMSMKLPINVVAIIAAAENMPSGTATKPGDVVTSMAGITIEILNTDAEGRLVLCDALTYTERFKPASVVDIATLTGACVVALGSHASGLYANDDQLAEKLLAAGTESHDRAWRMPLWDDYQRQLDSNFADVGNIGGPGGGSITAACFLARFTKKYRWAHLDIAGSAWNSSPKGATGRPVGLLTQYLCDQAGWG